jgi:hypothetical protein
MVWFSEPDCPVLADRTYASLNLNCSEPHVMCITNYLFTHTFVVHLECIHIGGALLDFLEKCVKWHFRPKLNFILYAHSEGELLYMYEFKRLIEYLL